MVLFASDKNLIFKGLYELEPSMELAAKIYGQGPSCVAAGRVYKFFKFSSASKSFASIPTTTYGYTVDAFALPPSMRNRPTPRTVPKTG